MLIITHKIIINIKTYIIRQAFGLGRVTSPETDSSITSFKKMPPQWDPGPRVRVNVWRLPLGPQKTCVGSIWWRLFKTRVVQPFQKSTKMVSKSACARSWPFWGPQKHEHAPITD